MITGDKYIVRNYLEPSDIKLTPLAESLLTDESYRAWLELVTQSLAVPAEYMPSPPKQGVKHGLLGNDTRRKDDFLSHKE